MSHLLLQVLLLCLLCVAYNLHGSFTLLLLLMDCLLVRLSTKEGRSHLGLTATNTTNTTTTTTDSLLLARRLLCLPDCRQRLHLQRLLLLPLLQLFLPCCIPCCCQLLQRPLFRQQQRLKGDVESQRSAAIR